MNVKALKRPKAVQQPRSIQGLQSHAVRNVDMLPPCEAKRISRYCPSFEAANPDKTCARSARYVVDGVNLCSFHAGEAALAHLLNQKQVAQ